LLINNTAARTLSNFQPYFISGGVDYYPDPLPPGASDAIRFEGDERHYAADLDGLVSYQVDGLPYIIAVGWKNHNWDCNATVGLYYGTQTDLAVIYDAMFISGSNMTGVFTSSNPGTNEFLLSDGSLAILSVDSNRDPDLRLTIRENRRLPIGNYYFNFVGTSYYLANSSVQIGLDRRTPYTDQWFQWTTSLNATTGQYKIYQTAGPYCWYAWTFGNFLPVSLRSNSSGCTDNTNQAYFQIQWKEEDIYIIRSVYSSLQLDRRACYNSALTVNNLNCVAGTSPGFWADADADTNLVRFIPVNANPSILNS
jgi:hypothetical protein